MCIFGEFFLDFQFPHSYQNIVKTNCERCFDLTQHETINILKIRIPIPLFGILQNIIKCSDIYWDIFYKNNSVLKLNQKL